MRTVPPNTNLSNHFVLFASYVKASTSAKIFASLSKYRDKIQLSSDSTLMPLFDTPLVSDLLHIEMLGKKVLMVTDRGFHSYSAGKQPGVAHLHSFERFSNAPGGLP